jgi:predicted DNA-binding protein
MKHGQQERTQVLLTPEQLGALKKLSAKTGAPLAELIRRAVNAYLKARKP